MAELHHLSLPVSMIASMIAPFYFAPAQNPAMTLPPSSERPGAEIVEGVAFQGYGSVSIQASSGGLPMLTYGFEPKTGDAV